MAESIRAVFAAFVWHEGIVHDTMAVASYLKFHPGLSKQGQNHGSAEAGGGAAGSDQDGAGGPTQQSKETKARQRHSVEVSHSELYSTSKIVPCSGELEIGQFLPFGLALGQNRGHFLSSNF